MYHSPIMLAALHVYHSAAATMPGCQLQTRFQQHENAVPMPRLISSRTSVWGQRVQVLEGHTGRVTSVACSPNGRFIVSGSDDRTARVWHIETETVQHILTRHTDNVHAVAWSPDSSLIATASQDRTVRLWDAVTGAEKCVLSGHGGSVDSVSFSPDGVFVATGSRDSTMRVWEVATGLPRRVLASQEEHSVASVAFSFNSQLIASGAGHYMPDRGPFPLPFDDIRAPLPNYEVRVWNMSTGADQHIVLGLRQPITSIAFSLDSMLIASGSDYEVRVWDVSTGAQQLHWTHRLHWTTGSVQCISQLSDSRWMCITSGGFTNIIKMKDKTTDVDVCHLKGHNSSIESATFSPGCKLIISGSADRTVRVWDPSSSSDEPFAHIRSKVLAVAFSADETMIVSGHEDGIARIWDVRTGIQQHMMKGHTVAVSSVAFSFSSEFIATGSNDYTIRLWDAATGTEQHIMLCLEESVTSIAFSPNGQLIASGGQHDRICIWDATAGTLLYNIKGHEQWVGALVAFSPDSQYVASASGRGVLRIRNAITGTEQQSMQGQNSSRIYSLAYSSDGQFLAAGSYGTVQIWDVSTGMSRSIFSDHMSSVESVAFLPGSSLVSLRSKDQTIQLWNWVTGAVIGPPQPGMPEAQPLAQSSPVMSSPFISVDRAGWVWRFSTRGVWQRVSWLPVDRRGVVAFQGQKLCVGADHHEGTVTILDFAEVGDGAGS
jgi:WD40 repeat protein